MAKSLEEHLYRSAQTKEQYLDMSTLKQRLQAIAHGLEVHRSSSGGAVSSGSQSSQGAHQPLQLQQTNSSWAVQQKAAPSSMQLNMGLQSSYPSGLDNSQSSDSDPLSASGAMGGGSSHSPADFLQRSALQVPSIQQATQWTGSQNASLQAGGLQSSQFNLGSLGSITPQQAAAVAMSQGSIGGLTNAAAMQMMGNSASMSSFPTTSQSQMNQPYLASGTALNHPLPQIGNEGGNKADDLVMLDDPAAAQKKKVILQQQQRLLLLRHASKCTVGPSCPTKFCAQMVTLWRHMKTCRDKNCRTSHCLSSRCVLNHYRICKSNGKTSTCEVCGPVMAKIKQVEREDTSSDPLTREQEQALANPLPPQASSIVQKDAHALAMPEQSQMQLLQSQKIQARIENLQQLQRQQNQLLEQQRRLQEQARSITDPSSQQAQQLQQQQILLTQLQNRCRQQQILLQKELHEQTGGHVPMLQPHEIQAQQQQQLLQLQALQATHHLQNAQGNQNAGPLLQLQALQSVETPTTDSQDLMLSLPDNASSEPAKKRRSRSDGKPTPFGRDGKGRRGSGIGKTMTMSQLAAVADVQPKKRQGASTPKERSQKKPKKGVTDSSSIPDQFLSGSVDSSASSESTLVSSMTKDEISRHIESLNKRIWLSSRMVTHKCLPIVQDLIDDPFGWVFIDAVDPVALGLPDYFEVVKNPMHLELVKKKLENAIYADMETFERDVKLVFENAILYNGEESEVGQLAQSMLVKFDQLYKDVVQG
jgi:Bromodomain/TAZ zinc finger